MKRETLRSPMLSAAPQPMASADGRDHPVFNGEIYNHRALRRELEAQGSVCRTHSDTEVCNPPQV